MHSIPHAPRHYRPRWPAGREPWQRRLDNPTYVGRHRRDPYFLAQIRVAELTQREAAS